MIKEENIDIFSFKEKRMEKIKEIQAMLKIIPLNIEVSLDDLKEIYSQNERTTNTKTSY